MMSMPVKDHLTFIQQFRTVGTHPVDREDAIDPGTAFSPGVDQVSIAAIVPERTGINPAFGFVHLDQWLPGAGRILSPGHKDPSVGVPEVNIEFAFVITNARRPDAITMLWLSKRLMRKFLKHVPDDRPVH